MQIAIIKKSERRSFLKYALSACSLLIIPSQKVQAWFFLPAALEAGIVIIGRIFARTIVRTAGRRLFSTRVASTVLAGATVSEFEVQLANLAEKNIKKIANTLNYPNDNYEAVWIKDSKFENIFDHSLENPTKSTMEYRVTYALLNVETGKIEKDTEHRVMHRVKPKSIYSYSLGVSRIKATGVMKIVMIDSESQIISDYVSGNIIVESKRAIEKII